MIAIARFAVQLPDEASATKEYTHRWMTESLDTAIAEIAREKAKIEQEEGWTLKLLDWTIQERTDIGY